MSLSDDPEAKEMVESMKMAAVMLGGDPSKTVNEIFDDLAVKIQSMRDRLKSRHRGVTSSPAACYTNFVGQMSRG